MTRTVMAFRLMDRTETQTDRAPSWMRAVAMAPAVIDARKGMSMELLSESGWWEMEKRPGIAPRALSGEIS